MRNWKSMGLLVLAGAGGVFSFPASIWEAKAGFPERQKKVVQWWLNRKVDSLTVWTNNDNAAENLRRIAAGLTALKIGDTAVANYPPAGYPDTVAKWLWNNVHKYTRVGSKIGSNGDYDMILAQMIALLYAFKDDSGLLKDTAVRALLCQNAASDYRQCLDIGFCQPVAQLACLAGCQVACPSDPACACLPTCGKCLTACSDNPCPAPYTGQSLDETQVQWADLPYFGTQNFPETENHVLMIYTWKYLLNQWIRKDYRGLGQPAYDSAIHNNEGKNVEKLLLEALTRIVRQDLFETNARAYQSLSMLPIMTLYSFADTTTTGGRKVRLAAQNALDFLAVKFAFQSFEGKRYGPSRRHWDYAIKPGIYDNDYVPAMFGILTGAYVSDDDPTCSQAKDDCLLRGVQSSAFALWASLLSYRVPDPILDFHLRKDNHSPGYGVWARMQARFTEKHYRLNKASAYKPNGVLGSNSSPDLSGEDRILAPEFYFLTQDYMNSAGGDYRHYAGIWPVPFCGFEIICEYDRYAKPTALLPKGNIGFWNSISQARDSVMMMKGDSYDSGSAFTSGIFDPPERNWWTSKNLGIYKNVGYGYSGRFTWGNCDTSADITPYYWLESSSIWPMSFPKAWTYRTTPYAVTYSLPGNDTLAAFTIYPLTSDFSSFNPNLGYYVVAMSIKAFPTLDGYWGIWEIVPESAFPGSQGLANLYSRVLNNLGTFPNMYPVGYDLGSGCPTTTGIVYYRSAVTDAWLSFEFGYGVPRPPYGNTSVREIESDTTAAQARYGELDSQVGIKAFPLIEVRQVDESYSFTDVYYVTSNDSGKIVINNPWMEWKIELDASDTSWYNPMRREEINTYYIHAGADPSNPGEFASWDVAYETVKDKVAQLSSYDKTIRFVYVSPEGTPVEPPSGKTYGAFPLSGGAGSVPFVLEGRQSFP